MPKKNLVIERNEEKKNQRSFQMRIKNSETNLTIYRIFCEVLRCTNTPHKSNSDSKQKK